MSDKEKKRLTPKIMGSVLPYWIELDSDSILSPEEKASKFPKREWKFDQSKMECVPGFDPALIKSDVLCVEYVEMKKVERKEFGEVVQSIYQRKSRVFDMMGNKKKGIILLHPNGVSANDVHLERYFGRLGYEKNSLHLKSIEFEEDAIKDVFISENTERRGIKLTEKGTEIEV